MKQQLQRLSMLGLLLGLGWSASEVAATACNSAAFSFDYVCVSVSGGSVVLQADVTEARFCHFSAPEYTATGSSSPTEITSCAEIFDGHISGTKFYYGINLDCTCSSGTTRKIGAMYTSGTDTSPANQWMSNSDQYACVFCYTPTGNGIVSGDPVVTGFDGTRFFYHAVHGQPVSMLSSPDHAVNVEIGKLANIEGSDNDEWVVAAGLRYQDVVATIRIAADDDALEVYHDEEANHASKRRMRMRNGTLPLELTVNGLVYTDMLYSGKSIDTGNKDVLLYMAPVDAVNPDDAFDGPLFTMRTPDWEITIFLESEDSLHLDLDHTILSARVQPEALHGVIGQTLAWKADDVGDSVKPHQHTMKGASEDYYLKDGLTGTQFTHSQFCWPNCASRQGVELRKLFVGGQVGADFTALMATARHT